MLLRFAALASLTKWVAALALCGCSSTPAAAPPPPPTTFGGNRPVDLAAPDGYDPANPYPLLIMLHGYQTSGAVEELYLQLAEPAAARGMLYVHPNGTIDSTGSRFWNDFPGAQSSMVDDVGYLTGLVAEISAAYHVDSRRIYFVGHSNGGTMSYRLACARADLIAAIGILAGDMPKNPAPVCQPEGPVSVLHSHGTADMSVPYDGNAQNLGAKGCVDFWAAVAHCSGQAMGPPLHLIDEHQGDETSVLDETGCASGIGVALWSIAAAGHIPAFDTSYGHDATYAEKMLDFLLAHPKP